MSNVILLFVKNILCIYYAKYAVFGNNHANHFKIVLYYLCYDH